MAAVAPPSCVHQVTVELKNDLAITGTLHSVDQYLNIKLTDIKVVNEQKYPHMVRPLCCVRPAHTSPQVSVTNCFIRGSVVRYVVVRGDAHNIAAHTVPSQLPEGSVDVELLHDSTRREARGQ